MANTTALVSISPSRKFTTLESVISISVVTDEIVTSDIDIVPVPSSFTDTSFPDKVTESNTWLAVLWLETMIPVSPLLIAVSDILTESDCKYTAVEIPSKSELLIETVPELVVVVNRPYVGEAPRVPSTSSPDIETVLVPSVLTAMVESSKSTPSADTSAPPKTSTPTSASVICELVSVVVEPESATTPFVLESEVNESMVNVP